MKCLVTGGAGFIGSHIVGKLLQNNHEVVVIDNESAESNDAFNWYDDHAQNHVVDIRDFDTCRPLFDGVEYVFHLAAHSRIQVAMERPLECLETNYLGTYNMLECARQAGVRRFINSSTSSSYGLVNEPPLQENMTTDCLNPYSASKIAGEKFCKMYTELYGLETVVLRYFNVFGRRSPAKGQYAPVIGIFQRQRDTGEPLTIVGDGAQRRDFVHVEDVARANYLAATMPLKGHAGEVFNVGTSNAYSIQQIADSISDNQVYIDKRSGEMETTFADITKIGDVLGWKPEIDVIDWIKNVN